MTMPETSEPGMKGRGGLSWYNPCTGGEPPSGHFLWQGLKFGVMYDSQSALAASILLPLLT